MRWVRSCCAGSRGNRAIACRTRSSRSSSSPRCRRRWRPFDPLTGAATREYLLERIERTERTHAESTSALAIVDLDRFKQVNDNHGHRVGDQALIALAETPRAHVRGGDVVARFGGDEFMMLLPGCDHERARRRMEAALSALRELRIGDDVRVTASAGIAIRGADESFDRWFARADEALYRAKQGGRDRVV